MATANNAYWKYKLVPTPEQEAILKKCLDRSSLFWNFCVDHLSFPATEYLAGPDTDEEDQKFYKRVDELMDLMVLASTGALADDTPGKAMLQDWLPFTEQMFELPISALKNRLDDLVSAYVAVKDNIRGEQSSNTSAPRRKTDTSSQSIRFEQADFEIKGTRLILKRPYPIEFTIPELVSLKVKAPYSLSITRRALMGSGKFGPAEKDDGGSLMLTIREA